MDWEQRNQVLWGEKTVESFKNMWVGIIGVGGVGSYVVEAIARSGIGHIVIVDKDTVDITNINRQLPALHSTVGMNKVDVLKERILDINPEAHVIALCEPYTKESSERLLSYPFDYVVDAIDSVPDKLYLIQTCYRKKIPFISAMGMANKKDPEKLKIADISKTEVCPLCKKVRLELKKIGITKGVKVVFSTEPADNANHDRNKLGSSAFVPSICGLMLASVVVRKLAEKAEPAE